MIQVALALVVLVQGTGLEVEVSSRKRGADYELEIRGRGPMLEGKDLVGIRFQRRVNRADGKERSIRTSAEAEPWGRCAHVRDGEFILREIFSDPAVVEVRLVLEEDGPDHLRVVGVGSPADVVRELARDVRAAEAFLGDLGKLLDKGAGFVGARGSRRGVASFLKGLERRRLALKEAGRESLLSATAHLLLGFVTDLEGAVECGRAANGTGPLRLSPRGIVATVEALRGNLKEIGRILTREQSLVLVQAASDLRDEIASAVEEPKRWTRSRRRLETAVRGLGEAEQAGRSGTRGESFAKIESSSGVTLAHLVAGTEEYFYSAQEVADCPELDLTELDRGHCWLADQASELETVLRTGP